MARRPGGAGEVRTQYAHIIDMVPTVLDLLGLQPPTTIRGVTQLPLHGVSLASVLRDGSAPSDHTTQYFEMLGPHVDSERAAEIMLGSGFRHLPVVAGTALVGIVSLRDLLSLRVRRHPS